MSIHKVSQQLSESAPASTSSRVPRELKMNPLWMVTFAAGLLFGMLAVLLTTG